MVIDTFPNGAGQTPTTMAWCEKRDSMADNKGALGDYYHDKGRLRKSQGLSWIMAAFFVVADMAGGGIVALPTAVVRCGFWLGICILVAMCIVATICSVMLGRAWEILLRRFPVYRTHCRKPYAEIGYRALGRRMKFFVSLCVNFTQFGASTVFLLLSAKNIDDFLRAFFGLNLGFCIVILIVAVLLLPVTFLKSPQDFWPVIVGGMVSTSVAVMLITLGSGMDYDSCGHVNEMPSLKLSNVLVALGTILFTYGGHSAFPTIQHDMKKPSEFGKSSILAFTIITILNLVAVCVGGWTYGNSLGESVINSIQTFWIQQAVNLMITAHCLLTVTLILNPLEQEMEEFFGIPQRFTVKRVVVRTGMLATVTFMALTLPNFGHVLDLIGGSTVTVTSIVFPCIFYLYLAAADSKANEPIYEKGICEFPSVSFNEVLKRTDRKTLCYCGAIIALGSIAGIVATGSAIKSLSVTHFVPPCYLSLFSHDGTTGNNHQATNLGVTNCCGPFQNISRFGPDVCSQQKTDFY